MIFRHGFVNQLNARVKKKTRSCALYTVHTPLIASKHYQTPTSCGHTYIGTIIHIPTASTTKKRFICMSEHS